MAFSPLVGIFGHRQVGKTTFAEQTGGSYSTLDDQATRESIKKDASKFLQNSGKRPTVIDECQGEPQLFPALKEWVRKNPRPGQFILTGSVRFTSRRAVRESLTGRLITVELLPLIISEFLQEPLNDILPRLLKARRFDESSLPFRVPHQVISRRKSALEKYLQAGGLPRIAFARSEQHRSTILNELHRLILDRDLRMVLETRLSLETLLKFLRTIALQGWTPWNASRIKREFGLAHQTQRNLLLALESIYLIRRIPLRGRRGEIILLEDQFEEFQLSRGQLPLPEQYLSAVYRNTRAQFRYRTGEVVSTYCYWSPKGAKVPLVFEGRGGTLGMMIIESDLPTLSERRSSDSFIRKIADAKTLYLSLTASHPKIIDERSMILPVATIL
jgi:hypothetical protein